MIILLLTFSCLLTNFEEPYKKVITLEPIMIFNAIRKISKRMILLRYPRRLWDHNFNTSSNKGKAHNSGATSLLDEKNFMFLHTKKVSLKCSTNLSKLRKSVCLVSIVPCAYLIVPCSFDIPFFWYQFDRPPNCHLLFTKEIRAKFILASYMINSNISWVKTQEIFILYFRKATFIYWIVYWAKSLESTDRSTLCAFET